MDGLRNLVAGVDFTPRSLSAAQMAVALAEPTQATVHLVHVVETQLSDSDALVLGKSRAELLDLLVAEAEAALGHFAEQLGYRSLRQIVTTGNPAGELARLSETWHADLLLVGDTGGESSMLPRGVGVTAYRLVERGPRNLLVVKAGYGGSVRAVAAAISFVPVGDDVLQRAHLLARLLRAELRVVRAIPDVAELRHRLAVLPFDTDRIVSDSVLYNEKRLEGFVGRYNINDVVLKTAVLRGKSGPALVEYLQNEDIDIVVMGTGTSYRIAGYPVGSTTHRVLNQTLSSVCVVRSLEPAP